jgi:hypothetical protein
MRPHDDAQRPPACENCEREMTLLGRLSEIGIHKACACTDACLASALTQRTTEAAAGKLARLTPVCL